MVLGLTMRLILVLIAVATCALCGIMIAIAIIAAWNGIAIKMLVQTVIRAWRGKTILIATGVNLFETNKKR